MKVDWKLLKLAKRDNEVGFWKATIAGKFLPTYCSRFEVMTEEDDHKRGDVLKGIVGCGGGDSEPQDESDDNSDTG